MNLSKEIASMYDDAVRIRQDLHRIPEIGFQLHDTQAYVLNELRQCAPDRLETPAVCGVKAVFFARDAETTIAFRADMDGIHNDEANNVPYCSQHPGNMHGCGHDGHMTILLLFARWIAKNRAHIHCNIVLLFQPGEEGWAGARRMIDDGALENPKVDRIYGLHLWPTVPKGKIGVRWDYLMAQTSDFEITVHGKSAHASTPQMGIDAIVVAAELVTMVQTVITRDVDPHQDALLTLGKIQGGTSHNVIAEEVTISGTLRVFSNDLYRTLSHKIAALMQGLETATGAQIDGASFDGERLSFLYSYYAKRRGRAMEVVEIAVQPEEAEKARAVLAHLGLPEVETVQQQLEARKKALEDEKNAAALEKRDR